MFVPFSKINESNKTFRHMREREREGGGVIKSTEIIRGIKERNHRYVEK